MTTTLTADRDEFLKALLTEVPFHGWTTKAMANVDPTGVQSRRLFPGGLVDAVAHFADWADREMEAGIAGVELDAFRIRDQIALLVKARLTALTPHKEAVRKEAAWLTLHAPDRAPRLLWRSADRMWRLAGDTATDFNHYSKRLLLAGVIASTTLCWLGDSSEGGEATDKFLDRRIDDVLVWGKRFGKIGKLADPTRVLDLIAGLAGKFRYRG